MTTQAASETRGSGDSEEPDRTDAHLEDVAVGSGCTEIWEHLSEQRGSGD